MKPFNAGVPQQHAESDADLEALGLSAQRRNQIGSLQILLWIVWTLVVGATGLVQWYRAIEAHQAIDLVGLVIHCSVAGVAGLIVMTWIEMRLEPWRFL